MPYDNDFTVRVKINLDRDGKVNAIKMLDHVRMNTPGQEKFRVFADSARRAIQLCSPLSLPKDKYSAWKELVLNFSTTDFNVSGSNSNLIAKQDEVKNNSVSEGNKKNITWKITSALITEYKSIVGDDYSVGTLERRRI